MNNLALQSLMVETRVCAMAMLDTGTYVQRELPGVQMDETLRAETERVCRKLFATKDETLAELSELDELRGNGAQESVVVARAVRIVETIWRDLEQLHKIVTTLDAAMEMEHTYGLAYMLAAESDVNILNPYNRARQAADELQSTGYPNGND